MIINISNLSEGEHSFIFNVKGDELSLNEFDFRNDVKVSVTLFKTHNQADLRINIDAVINMKCDRCLEEFDFNLKNDFKLIYKYSYDKNDIDENDDKLNDFKVISPDVHNIDIKDEIREYILLSIPMKRVPELVGDVCVFCKKNINELLKQAEKKEINPVWEKLLKNKN
jgi:uncharacterized protein